MSRIPVISAYVLVGAAVASMVAPSILQAQQENSLVGTLFDQQTRQPLAGGTITIDGGDRQAQSAQDGSFTLTDLPPGPVTLRLSAVGYATAVEQVEVPAGGVLFHQFAVLPLTATLGEVLVLAGGSRAGLDSSAEVAGDDRGVAGSAADLLAQRVPGLTFSRKNGNVGTSAQIVIRGVSTITQSSAPVIFLDGIRLGQPAGGLGSSRNDTSFDILEAIPASDVRRIRVLRGSSASAAYGDSANGVILIETRRDASE